MIRSKKRTIIFILISIAVMLITGCSALNNSLTSHAEKEISENDFDLVNAYKRYVGHAELTAEDAKHMQEYPIYPNGKSRWDRVVDFVKSRHTIDDQFNVHIYEEIPESLADQLDMVNMYYGELGGGFHYLSRAQSYDKFDEYATIDDDGKTQWRHEIESVFYCMQLLKKRRPSYDGIPVAAEDQFNMVQYYHMELTYLPLDLSDLDYYMKNKEDKQWEELLQFVLTEFNGEGPIMKTYESMPEELEVQWYMVNACNKQVGNPPILKSEAIEMINTPEDGKTRWENYVDGAYHISNEKLGKKQYGGTYVANNEYPNYHYYWFEYSRYGDEAFDLSKDRIAANF